VQLHVSRSQEVNKRKNRALQQIVYDITTNVKDYSCVDHYNATSYRIRKFNTELNCNYCNHCQKFYHVPIASDAAKHKANNIFSTRATFKKAPARSK